MRNGAGAAETCGIKTARVLCIMYTAPLGRENWRPAQTVPCQAGNLPRLYPAERMATALRQWHSPKLPTLIIQIKLLRHSPHGQTVVYVLRDSI